MSESNALAVIGAYVLGHDHYITRTGSSKILGRASGNVPGGYWYQLAAKPYDEPEVMGFASLAAAFESAVAVLEARHVPQSPATARSCGL